MCLIYIASKVFKLGSMLDSVEIFDQLLETKKFNLLKFVVGNYQGSL